MGQGTRQTVEENVRNKAPETAIFHAVSGACCNFYVLCKMSAEKGSMSALIQQQLQM